MSDHFAEAVRGHGSEALSSDETLVRFTSDLRLNSFLYLPL